MSTKTVISPAVRTEILAAVDQTDGSDRALDRLAGEYGMFLAEIKDLIRSRDRAVRKIAAPAAPVATKVCSQCDVEQPLTSYYEQKGGRDGRMAHCMTCNNKRPPTESRLVRNRARTRAYIALSKRHATEFAELFDAELERARTEHVEVKRAATGRPDAEVARLRPGPKRGSERVTDRLDVARCQTCHTHHDAEHECPSCGDITPETAPAVKPWQVREWAVTQDIAVPTRGPIPEAVMAAYNEKHLENAS